MLVAISLIEKFLSLNRSSDPNTKAQEDPAAHLALHKAT
jgi:hypothetical protein